MSTIIASGGVSVVNITLLHPTTSRTVLMGQSDSTRTSSVNLSLSGTMLFSVVRTDQASRRSAGDPGYGGMPISVMFLSGTYAAQGLEWMMYQPGDHYYDEFTLIRPDTGQSSNADLTPTVTVIRNGAATVEMIVSISNTESGVYKTDGIIPTDWAKGDTVQVYATAIVAGKTQKAVVSSFVLTGTRSGGQVWP